jgi:cytoskeletal protein CcmA (bactofilin family)
MHDIAKWTVSGIGAVALVASVLTNAAASKPPTSHASARSNKGSTVNGTLHVKGNINVKTNSYMRGKAEVDKGLLVKNGIRTDALTVNGNFSAAGGTISTNLAVTQGLSAGTLSVSGAAAVGSLDAGSGAIKTTGSLTAGGATVSSLNDTGSLTAANATLSGLVVSGPVDFSHATVTGLSQGGSFTTLTVGGVTATSPPLTIVENGQSSTIGVNNSTLILGGSAAPNVSTTGNLSVGGNLTVTGTSNLSVSSLTAPNQSGTTTPGQFTITGNPIQLTGAVQTTSSLTVGGATTLNGNTTVSSGNDLNLPFTAQSGSTAANAAHLVASGNRDVAGTVTVNVPANTAQGTEITTTVTFTRNYAGTPFVVLTPTTDPGLNGGAARYWVTPVGGGPYTGFAVHYVTSGVAIANAQSVTFNYHVIGG